MTVSKLKSKTLQWHKTVDICAIKDSKDVKCYLRALGLHLMSILGQKPATLVCLNLDRQTDVSCKVRREHGSKFTEKLTETLWDWQRAMQVQGTGNEQEKKKLRGRNNYSCLQLFLRERMENEAKGK